MSLSDANTICGCFLKCWDRTAKYRGYIRSLGDNLTALEDKMKELDDVYNDVCRVVSAATDEGWEPKHRVDGWLKKVETLQKESNEVLTKGKKIAERKCLCGLCCWNCCSRYRQSVDAEAKKTDLEAPLAQGLAFKDREQVADETADLILKRTLSNLCRKSDELEAYFKTVKQRVESEEEHHNIRTAEVDDWWKRVEGLLGEVKESRRRLEADLKNQRNHELSKLASELEEALTKGHAITVFTYEPDDPLIVEAAMRPPIGMESIFEEVWEWVENKKVRCIGLWGMGGVGKTTLLEKIHNQFLQVHHDYDLVVKFVVSKPANPEKLQETLWEKLKLSKDEWDATSKGGDATSKGTRVDKIHSLMMKKNFLLFLDDLWDTIDLVKDVGIPSLEKHPKKCKIVFTTRSVDVCNGMNPDESKKVDCLRPDKALELFRRDLGEKTWGAHPRISEIAESMIKECEYLPLALIIVARVMAGKREIKDWEVAEEVLRQRSSEFPEMEEKVLERLKFSYDSLPDETYRKCFLHLSIFPEDYEIPVDSVIDYWIGEGFLNMCKNAHEARSKGGQILRSLSYSCLVESMPGYEGSTVRMHDVVREMALWVASKYEKISSIILVQQEMEPFQSKEELENWKDAQRISVWQADESLQDCLAKVSCTQLSTLIICNTQLKTIPEEFFSSASSLKVLDLSQNGELAELPGSIGQSTNLQYLNLLGTRIEELPLELGDLANLMVLMLERDCKIISTDFDLSKLESLKVFWWVRTVEVSDSPYEEHAELKVLEELEDLGVEEINIWLQSSKSVEKLLSRPKLQSCFRELSLAGCEGLNSFNVSKSVLRRLKQLESLTLLLCEVEEMEMGGDDEGTGRSDPARSLYSKHALLSKPSGVENRVSFSSLTRVTANWCMLRDLTSLIYHAPKLETLNLENCSSMVELISGDVEEKHVKGGVLTSLVYLHLEGLPKLESICSTALPFPILKRIRVYDCPKLKKLPLDRDSAKNRLEEIEGRGQWLDALEWDDPVAKWVFSPKFIRNH